MWKRITSQHKQAALENICSLLQIFFKYPFQKVHVVIFYVTAFESSTRKLEDLHLSEDGIITKITSRNQREYYTASNQSVNQGREYEQSIW
jgi:hypothetical protein